MKKKLYIHPIADLFEYSDETELLAGTDPDWDDTVIPTEKDDQKVGPAKSAIFDTTDPDF